MKVKIDILKFSDLSEPNYASFNILVRPKIREKLITFLKKHNIDTTIYYPKTIPEHKPYKKFLLKNDLIASKFISKRILSLPFHPYIKFKKIKFIVETISKFYKNK